MILSLDDPTQSAPSAGVYSFPQVSQILGRVDETSAGTVRRWWRAGLTPGAPEDEDLLTFHDLISLEIVRRFRGSGVSLQKVRRVEAELKQRRPDLLRPFAHRLFFTDGANVWAEVNGHAEEIIGKNKNHMVFVDAIRTFADEIRYESDVAVAWDISEMVEVDPLVNFGQPVVRGTRIPTRTVLQHLSVAEPDEVADMYGLSVVQVNGVIGYATAA